VFERLIHGLDRRVRMLRAWLREARPSIQAVKNRFHGPIVGCEVGVFRGIHAEQMLRTLPNLVRLYLVDPYTLYEGYTDFKNASKELLSDAEKEAHPRLEQYKSRIIWVREKFEAKHIPEPLDFIYIDGQHTYEAVTHDIWHAEKRVKNGGIIAGHDYYPEGHYLNKKFGVGKAVRDYYGSRHRWELNDWWVIRI